MTLKAELEEPDKSKTEEDIAVYAVAETPPPANHKRFYCEKCKLVSFNLVSTFVLFFFV